MEAKRLHVNSTKLILHVMIPPAFVGSDYFCESGRPERRVQQKLYSDPLWDGQGCGSLHETACYQAAAGIPLGCTRSPVLLLMTPLS